VKQFGIQVQDREKGGEWRPLLDGTLLVRDQDAFFVNVFLRMGIDIILVRTAVSSIAEATAILNEYEGNENFLVGSVESE
jgi:hypothetical protein